MTDFEHDSDRNYIYRKEDIFYNIVMVKKNKNKKKKKKREVT